jgi:hypothetical protein
MAIKLGELLIEAGVIDRTQLAQALQHQRTYGGRLGTNLVELGILDEKTLAGVLAKQMSIPSATAAQLDRVDPAALRLLRADVAERLRAVPLREDAGRLWVAMADPTDQVALKELERLVGKPIRAMVAPELLIQYALEKHFAVRRKPRVMTVREGSGLLDFDGHRTPRIASAAPASSQTKKGPPPPPAAEAPVWNWYGDSVKNDAVDSLSGYLDEQAKPAVPKRERPPLKIVAEKLLMADSDEAVFDVALSYVGIDAQRLAAFLLRNGQLVGWRGHGVDEAQLRKVKIKLEDAPMVAGVLASGQPWVGRVQLKDLGSLATPLGVRDEGLGVVLPVRIGKRAVAAVVGLEASPDILQHASTINKLANKIDQALHIGYLRRQILSDD